MGSKHSEYGFYCRKGLGPNANEFYALKIVEQSGLCAICCKPETAIRKGKLKELVLDHCHETGRLRGVICHLCNTGLHRFKDSPVLLGKAKEYLWFWENTIKVPLNPFGKKVTLDYLIKQQYEYRENRRVIQKNLCGICGLPETKLYRGFVVDLCLDHDHEDEGLRGLLCYDCNRGIGCFKDDISNLEDAISYLSPLP